VASGAQFDYAGFGGSNTRGYNFNIGGSGPDGSGVINNTGAAISGNSSVSNVTLTADAVIGGTGRWDLGTGAGNTVLNGNGFNLVKVGTYGTSLRQQVITNVASITVSNGNAWYENFNQTNAWTATITNYIKPGTILGNYAGVTNNMPIVLDDATIRNEGGGNTPLWLGPVSLASSSVFNNGGVQSFNGVISGPGGINVNGGTAALTFSNANTYAGGTIISNAPVTTAAVDATAGSAAVIAAHPSAFGTGPLTISGLAHAALTNGTYFASNVLRAVEFAFASPGTVSNSIVLPSTAITNVSLHGRDSAQAVNLSGVISGGFTGMTNWIDFGDASAIGVMRYGNPANTFLGNISAFRGLLAITADGSLGNSANVLRLNNTGGLRFDAPGISVAHNISCTASTAFDVFGDNDGDSVTETGNSATITGIISGSTAITVKCGTNLNPAISGSLTLGGNNTFSGALTISPFTKVVASHLNGLGAASAGTTVNNGGTLALNANGTYANEPLTLSGSGVSGVGALQNLSGANILNSNISLAFPTTVGVTSGSLTVAGVISGAFPLYVTGPGTLTLSGANSYSAGTYVTSGTLLLNGSLPVGNAVTVGGFGTLGGVGTINGPVAILGGGTLQPGTNGIGQLTVASTLSLSGSTLMEISKTANTNDVVATLSSVTYGGALVVNNLGGTLVNGDKFTLFSATGRSGAFASLTLPALDPGLGWSNKLVLDGSIEVVSNGVAAPLPTTLTNSITGNQLTLSWPAGQGWRLLSQTNARSVGLTTPTNNWYEFAPAASNTVTISIEKTNPTVFFRLMYP
jgi:autotransporter-associated beta strand protein